MEIHRWRSDIDATVIADPVRRVSSAPAAFEDMKMSITGGAALVLQHARAEELREFHLRVDSEADGTWEKAKRGCAH